MDTGMTYVPLRTELTQLPEIKSARDVNTIIDLFIGREGSWHTGPNPIQNIFSCIYLEDILTTYIKSDEEPFVRMLETTLRKKFASPEDNSDIDTPNPLDSFSMYHLILFAYLTAALKTWSLSIQHLYISEEFVLQEEDITTNTFDFNLLRNIPTSRLIQLLTEITLFLNDQAKVATNTEAETIKKNPPPAKKQAKPAKAKKGGKSKSSNNNSNQTAANSPKPQSYFIEELQKRVQLRIYQLSCLQSCLEGQIPSNIPETIELLDMVIIDLPSYPAVDNSKSDKKNTGVLHKFNDAFSMGIQSRINNVSPNRSLTTLSPGDGYLIWKSIFLTVDSFKILEEIKSAREQNHPHQPAHLAKSSGNLRSFFVYFGGSKPTLPISSGPFAGQHTQPLPLPRAILHNITIDSEARFILGEPVVDWVLRDMNELSVAPLMRALLNNGKYSLSKKHPRVIVPQPAGNILEAVEPIKDQIDTFLEDASQCYILWLFSFVCNRSRQRQMLGHNIVMWDSLEVSAQMLETAINQQLERFKEPVETFQFAESLPDAALDHAGIPKNSVKTETRPAFPLVWWASIRRMFIIESVILLGFELEIYKPWEYAYMYLYAEQVQTEILNTLNVCSKYLNDAVDARTKIDECSGSNEPKLNLFKGDLPTFLEDINLALQYINGLQLEQSIMRGFSESYKQVSESAVLLKCITVPSSITKFTSAKLLYRNRMKLFSSVGYPAPPELPFEYESESTDFVPFIYTPNPKDPDDELTQSGHRLKAAKATALHLYNNLASYTSSEHQNTNSETTSRLSKMNNPANQLSPLKASAESVIHAANKLELYRKQCASSNSKLHPPSVKISFSDVNGFYPALIIDKN